MIKKQYKKVIINLNLLLLKYIIYKKFDKYF